MSWPMTRRMPLRLILVLLLLATETAGAHDRSTSYSSWELEQTSAQVAVRIRDIDLTRLGLLPDSTPKYEQAVLRALMQDLILLRADTACAAHTPSLIPLADGWLGARWELHCAGAGTPRIEFRLFGSPLNNHQHILNVRGEPGVAQRVLSGTRLSWASDFNQAAPALVGSTIGLGFRHILSGWDHLAFLLALLLLCASLGELVLVVSGFTLAHSLTLALAVLGWARPEAATLEALIALTIILVAAETSWQRSGQGWGIPLALTGGTLAIALLPGNGLAWLGLASFTFCHFALLRRTQRAGMWRAGISFAFGLFHGFGFAGALSSMSAPATSIWPGLLGFNLGVELGQLLVVLVSWPLLRWLSRKFHQTPDLVAAGVAGLGSYWLVIRLAA